MSQSARSSPMAKTRGATVPEVTLDEIGRATEAAFARVSSARSRLEAQRRAKSMPNTPVAVGRADDGVSASARIRGRVDAGATRLDFLKMIDEEERTQEEVAEDAKLESANSSSSSEATASVRPPPMDGVKEEASSASSERDSPAREPEVARLIEAAVEKCKTLQIEELDGDASVKKTRDVERRAREEAVAMRSVTNSPAPPPKSAPRDAEQRPKSSKPALKQPGGGVSAAHMSFKAPESYRNSRETSTAAPAQRARNAAQESQQECVIM